MWAHYANNHKGFALGYNFRNNRISKCSNYPKRDCPNIRNSMIYPIIYSDKRYDATGYGQWIVLRRLYHETGMLIEKPYDDNLFTLKAALHKSVD